MIAAWMLWSIGAGLLSLVAGLAVERLLEGGRRWVWVGAGAATVLLPASRFLSGWGGADAVAPPTAAVRLEPLTVTVAKDSVLHSLDDALLLGWLALSSVLVVGALVAAARFMWRRRGWEEGMLLGRRVLWSRDSGPAVVGLAMSSIVVPRWVSGAGRARQELVLAHEEEHLRARDAHLLLLAALLLFVFPWNPVLWIQYRRLGLAVELDCDRRVMRRWPARRRLYGDLLLRVGTGGGALRAMGAAALAERPSLLERRIRALLSGAPEVRMAQAAFLGFCALLAVGVALMAPGIARERAEPEPEREPPAEADADLAEGPAWTPRDTDPQYANREEIEAALVREYPPPLRDAGVGGRVVVWLLVDEAGKVRKTRIQAGSGHRGLDEAALRVADVARFSPALHRGRPVPVWIALPIVFGVK